MTGEGIFDAVASGALAGRAALLGAGRGRRAPGGDAPQLRAALPARRAMARLAVRPAVPGRGRSAASAHRRVFDAAVRLGLARGTVPPAALALILAHLVGAPLIPTAQPDRAGPAASSRATASTATASTARNGAREPGRRPARNPTARTSAASTGRPPRAGRAPARRPPAPRWPRAAGGRRGMRLAVRPSRCGRPRTPVAASSSRSGSTLAKWAPAPSSAPANGSHHGRRRRAGQREHDEHGQQAEADDVGQHRGRARLQPEVVGQPGRHRDQVRGAGQRRHRPATAARRPPRPPRSRPDHRAVSPPRPRPACRAGPPCGRARRPAGR